MNSLGKRVATGVAVCVALYFVALPMFWPMPRFEASPPATASMRSDIEIPIRLSAWHSNVRLNQVRFYVDFYQSTAKGPKGLFNPTIIFEGTAQEGGVRAPRNLLTRPWRDSRKLTLPLREFAAQGLVGPGLLVGKVDGTFSYTRVGRRRYGTRMTTTTQSIPFRIEVTQ